MKWVTYSVLVLTLGGCYFHDCTKLRNANRQFVNQLTVGMAEDDVKNLMGQKSCEDSFVNVIGQKWIYDSATNPYRREILQVKGKDFEVLYYYTDMKKNDNAITDDELTPLVFDEGKLIGWGWGFLEQNVQKYEIRFR